MFFVVRFLSAPEQRAVQRWPSPLQEIKEMKPMRDEDIRKGAVEQEAPRQFTNENFAGQNPHRGANPLAEGQDTDFPEPGGNPEHSGEPQAGGIANRGDRPLNTPRGESKDGATAKAKGETERDQSRTATAQQSPERDRVDQDPGERQKRNQGDKKDDPLAA
jgi:hypothetical protein